MTDKTYRLDWRGTLTAEQVGRIIDAALPQQRTHKMMPQGATALHTGYSTILSTRGAADEAARMDWPLLRVFGYEVSSGPSSIGGVVYVTRYPEYDVVRSLLHVTLQSYVPSWLYQITQNIVPINDTHDFVRYDFMITFDASIDGATRVKIWRHLADVLQSPMLSVSKVNGDDAPDGLHVYRVADDECDPDYAARWSRAKEALIPPEVLGE